jgi:acyl-CoA synthetase (AMP-forming)/AMP-acid ligase II
MSSYLGMAKETAQVLQDGWLDTGDLGFAMAGRLYVVGRHKDIIIVRGANHRPEEFEECLAGMPGVRPGRVVAAGFPDPHTAGEQLLLLVELAPGRTGCDQAALATDIRRRVRQRTGIQPGRVVLLAPGTLPRTSSGKLRRAEALRRYLAAELTPPDQVNPVSLASHLVSSALGFWQGKWRA